MYNIYLSEEQVKCILNKSKETCDELDFIRGMALHNMLEEDKTKTYTVADKARRKIFEVVWKICDYINCQNENPSNAFFQLCLNNNTHAVKPNYGEFTFYILHFDITQQTKLVVPLSMSQFLLYLTQLSQNNECDLFYAYSCFPIF